MRISDWSSDVCSSDLADVALDAKGAIKVDDDNRSSCASIYAVGDVTNRVQLTPVAIREGQAFADTVFGNNPRRVDYGCIPSAVFSHPPMAGVGMTEAERSEEHTSELQSLMRISYAVFCLKKKKQTKSCNNDD